MNKNSLRLELEHIFFERNRIDKILTKIDGMDVSIWQDGIKVFICIEGKCKIEKIENEGEDVLSILSICLGGYPGIIKKEKNGSVIDISNLAGKYRTWSYFQKNNLCICNIDNSVICQPVLDSYRVLSKLPIFSMQNLISENYQSIMSDHRITLLLHVIDGLVNDSVIPQMTSELKNRYNFTDKVGTYKPKVYYLLKNYFFGYHRKFNCEILQLLHVNQKQFIGIICDTRNWYSHFLKYTTKKNRMHSGKEMLIYFEIIYYVLRLYLLDELKVEIDETQVREYFYCIHDWISEIKEKNCAFKSNTYKINKGLEEMQKVIKNLTIS